MQCPDGSDASLLSTHGYGRGRGRVELWSEVQKNFNYVLAIFVKAQNVHLFSTLKDAVRSLGSFQTIAFIVFKWRKNHTPALKLKSSSKARATHENAGGEEEGGGVAKPPRYKVTLGFSKRSISQSTVVMNFVIMRISYINPLNNCI